MPTLAAQLYMAVKAECPHIDGASIGNRDDRNSWGVTFPDGTDEGIVEAETEMAKGMIATFEPTEPVTDLPR